METREQTQADVSALPKIACLTITYNRPHLLPNLIESFIRQDYPLSRRELIILDDLGQYPGEPSGDGWQVISVKRRFETLSAKRNALAAMTPNDIDAVAIWDDDDTYLPWCLLSHAWALKQSPVSHPHLILNESSEGELSIGKSGQKMYQASQCIDRDLFLKVGGYPRGNSGVDQQFVSLLTKTILEDSQTPADPTWKFPPWYVYGWSGTGSVHLSTLGKDGYDGHVLEESGSMGRENQVSDLIPKWRKNWMIAAKEFLGIPVDCGTYDLPAWWEGSGHNPNCVPEKLRKKLYPHEREAPATI